MTKNNKESNIKFILTNFLSNKDTSSGKKRKANETFDEFSDEIKTKKPRKQANVAFDKFSNKIKRNKSRKQDEEELKMMDPSSFVLPEEFQSIDMPLKEVKIDTNEEEKKPSSAPTSSKSIMRIENLLNPTKTR